MCVIQVDVEKVKENQNKGENITFAKLKGESEIELEKCLCKSSACQLRRQDNNFWHSVLLEFHFQFSNFFFPPYFVVHLEISLPDIDDRQKNNIGERKNNIVLERERETVRYVET